jgi:hypothetical protein
MEKIILYVDDAAYAREYLAGMAADAGVRDDPRHWVLVGCAPRVTHRINKWVSHSARENWRNKWFGKLQEQLMPALRIEGNQITPLLAKGPLSEITRRLRLEFGTVRVIDARRPKAGLDLEPLAPDAAPPRNSGRALPGVLLGLGTLLMLAGGMSD